MDCISFFDWCPSYDLMLTNAPNYEEMNPSTWVSVALSKMKPTGSAYIAVNGKPDELKAFLNAPIPDGVRLEEILIWSGKGCRSHTHNGEKYHDNYEPNYAYKIFYYRGKESRELNEPCIIKDVVNFINEKNAANDSLYIIQSSNEGDIVVDPFGNEKTLFRASKLGRKVYGAIDEDIKNEDDIDKSKIGILLTSKFCKLGDVHNSEIHELLSTKLKKAS
jgi:hypothetical protein